MLRGLPDLGRWLEDPDVRVAAAFDSDSFVLVPGGVVVATLPDGRPDLRLDIVRGQVPFLPPSPYAVLEAQLEACSDAEPALRTVRAAAPGRTLTEAVLSDWTYRVLPDALDGSSAASDDLRSVATSSAGPTRTVVRLDLLTAALVERLLLDPAPPVTALATADLHGVSPRLRATARLDPHAVVEALLLATGGGPVTWTTLRDALGPADRSVPIDLEVHDPSPAVDPAEALADRVAERLGRAASAPAPGGEPLIELVPADQVPTGTWTWDLDQPFPAKRRLSFPLDLFGAARRFVAANGSASIVRRIVVPALPTGFQPMTVSAKLPSRRTTLAAVGATVVAPPHPPARPHPAIVTVELAPPEHTATTALRLAPGEPLVYEVHTFAVVEHSGGVRQLEGPPRHLEGPLVGIAPGDLPVTFASVQATAGLLRQADIRGTCRFRMGLVEVEVAFALSADAPEVAVAVPRGAPDASLSGRAVARSGDGVLPFGPLPLRDVRLDLMVFAGYGPHVVDITCQCPPGRAVCAIDVVADGGSVEAGDLEVLSFTPDQPTRRWHWSASSPFRPGFSYRRHDDGAPPATWVAVTSPAPTLELHHAELPT